MIKKFRRYRKFHNKPVYTTAAGLFVTKDHPDAVKKAFDSEKEYKRWLVLREDEKAGRIRGLRCQKTFLLRSLDGTVLARYKSDFVYWEGATRIVEDVKSPVTRKLPMYCLKRKWMLAQYGITIRET